jgi:hypothetical protein
MEFVVILVVHEEDISLTKTHTKSNIINWKIYNEMNWKKNGKLQENYDGLESLEPWSLWILPILA